MDTLRVVTYLAPSIPERFFSDLTVLLGRRLGVPAELRCVTHVSGPDPADEPFSDGSADLAFVCGPSVAAMAGLADVVAVPVFGDPRDGGRPVYFADVVVRAGHEAASVSELLDATWAYNDERSLSGFLSTMDRIGDAFRGRFVASGCHLRSLELVAAGEVDAATIDSHVLWLAARTDPSLLGRLRVVVSWGPYPAQPVLVRTALPPATKLSLSEALCDADASTRRLFDGHGIVGFVPADVVPYEDLPRGDADGNA